MSYFLQLEFLTKNIFETRIIDAGIKVLVPHQIPTEFHKLHTVKDVKFVGTNVKDDIKKLQTQNTDCDIFCLTVSDEFDEYTVFDLCNPDGIVENIVAFVCIPKNEPEYEKSEQEYLDGIRVILENYYNNVNQWNAMIMDNRCLGATPEEYYHYVVDDCFVYYDKEEFNKEAEDWFEICKTKYGLSQQDINEAKNIIKFHKMSDKTVYKIPQFMALPIVLGKDNFKLDLCDIKHLLITGRTGAGKTTLLKSILMSINHQPKTANCKIVLIDTKDVDFKGYSSEYLKVPVITNAKKAVEYLNQIQPGNEDIAIVIDEFADLIAVQNDIQNILVKLAKNPKIHIILATRKIDLLSVDFMEIFHNRVVFDIDKVGEFIYLSDETNDKL